MANAALGHCPKGRDVGTRWGPAGARGIHTSLP